MAQNEYPLPRGEGWINFAMFMIAISGFVSVVAGIAAIFNSHVYDERAEVVFDSLKTWGWIVLLIGLLQFAVVVGIQLGTQWARWAGAVLASLSILGHVMWANGNPWWSLTVIGLDVLVIYALMMYGGRRYE
jgi:hypothetical protein